MSQKYTGGFITKSPVAPTSSAASGIWTLDQQQQAQKAGTWPSQLIFIEDLFSTYLYTGNGSTQTITNGIDLAGEGGLVWSKCRSSDLGGNGIHTLMDTIRGAGYRLSSEDTGGQVYNSNTITAFSSTGFSIGNSPINNTSAATFASWTFRKQPKFFDVVTFSTTNSANARISHNLGSVPACYIIKRIDGAGNWFTYHTSLGRSAYLSLNATNASASATNCWGTSDPTTTDFGVNEQLFTNGTVGLSYVAYLFAHNAGGFPASGSGSNNGISCGSFTESSSVATVNLGYEPQWVLIKRTDTADNWFVVDNMRGVYSSVNNPCPALFPNTSGAESSGYWIGINATGFDASGLSASGSYIYIAIRRGPMKVPTSGTSVFLPTSRTGNASLTTVTSGFAPDVVLARRVDTLDNGNESVFADKLRGAGTISTNNTAAEYAGGATSGLNAYTNTGVVIGTNNSPIYAFNYSGLPYALYQFQRAPNFMDEVCYTGTGSGTTITHNLGVTPELVITKSRTNGALGWVVWTTSLTNTDYWIRLDSTMAQTNSPVGYGGTFSASNYTIANTGPYNALNGSGQNFVAYLFATCAGVSKVGSYTGTGALQTVNCGFAAGARFVLIKRTDSTGDWWTYDSARGITAGNDPYLFLNSTAAEVTGTNYVDTDTTGFKVTAAAPAGLNANGGTYIFLAIA